MLQRCHLLLGQLLPSSRALVCACSANQAATASWLQSAAALCTTTQPPDAVDCVVVGAGNHSMQHWLVQCTLHVPAVLHSPHTLLLKMQGEPTSHIRPTGTRIHTAGSSTNKHRACRCDRVGVCPSSCAGRAGGCRTRTGGQLWYSHQLPALRGHPCRHILPSRQPQGAALC